MTKLNPPPARRAFARQHLPARVPFVMAMRQSARPLTAQSLRVPVTPANRGFLRELRAAEMRAWHNPSAAHAPSAVSRNRIELQRERKELAGFALVVTLALALAGVVLAHSTSVTRQCTQLVSFVRQFLG